VIGLNELSDVNELLTGMMEVIHKNELFP